MKERGRGRGRSQAAEEEDQSGVAVRWLLLSEGEGWWWDGRVTGLFAWTSAWSAAAAEVGRGAAQAKETSATAGNWLMTR